MFFNGCYERTIDPKNRIVMPPKLRDALGAKEFVIFTDPTENFIRLYRIEQWEEMTDKLLYADDGVDRTVLQRALYRYSENCELDSQSRFVLPPQFVERAGIVRDIVIIGLGKRIEIWAKDRYEETVVKDDATLGKITLKY